VLVVEDETSVRRLARKVLERHGYRVLEAAGPTEAFAIFDKHGKEIDLLLTDVIMPTMDGRQLSQRLLAIRPQLKVLFMSGYTEDVIAHHGVLDSNTSFMQKPFSIETLVRRVRETLDS